MIEKDNMKISICSFSFHRLLGEGKQDIFQYIKDCKNLGCTHLQPWNAHFALSAAAGAVKHLGRNPGEPEAPEWLLPPADKSYLNGIRAAAEEAGMPFEMIAVDRAHVFEAREEKRRENRQRAYQWLDIAETLGADGVRIDAGGPEEMPDEVFKVIVEGYNDLIARGRDKGVRIFTENHWGPSRHPENVIRLMENIAGLNFLFDTNNWAPGKREEGWEKCAKYAGATHIKTFRFDEQGNEPSVDIPRAIRMLAGAGFNGVWGVESVPKEMDEMEGARKTIALIRRTLERLN